MTMGAGRAGVAAMVNGANTSLKRVPPAHVIAGGTRFDPVR